MKQTRVKIIIMHSLVLAVLAAAHVIMLAGFGAKEYGHLAVNVVDAYTLIPVNGAYVACRETGEGAYASSGQVKLFSIDAEPKELGAGYGEATLVAYAEGYMPSIMLRVHIYAGRVRSGPTIYMFPKGSEEDISVTVFSEAPDEYLMEELAGELMP